MVEGTLKNAATIAVDHVGVEAVLEEGYDAFSQGAGQIRIQKGTRCHCLGEEIVHR